MKNILLTLIKKQTFLLLLVLLLVGGYLLWQVSLISSLTPDQETLDQKRQEIKASAVRFDSDTLRKLEEQNLLEAQSDTGNLGKANPFF